MNLAGNTILVTGGASGIGLALAERFLKGGSEVILCGRRADKLEEAKRKHPQFHTRVVDVGKPEARVALFDWASHTFPSLNMLVNNAGIQRRIALSESETWEQTREEIAINLEAPIHLSRLFIPHLFRQKHPYLVNVTSGLSFAPLANVPVYCATKAALHSFTLSLRHQLAATPIRVIEIIPPAVNTDLGGPGLHTYGVALEEFTSSIVKGMAAGQTEVAYGFSEKSRNASRAELDDIFRNLNEPRTR